MSATPIPRTMLMTIYGDMDTSIIKNKPRNRKEIKTYSKLDSKTDEVVKFVKKQIDEAAPHNKIPIFEIIPTPIGYPQV